MRQFFLVINPGLEAIAVRELQFWFHQWQLPPPVTQLDTGGVHLELPLEYGCALNRFLKVPTRILLRLASFRCRDLPSLYQKMQKIDWRQYLARGELVWNITASSSRLNNEKRILSTCEEAYAAYQKAFEPKKSQPPATLEVLVRVVADQCTVSVNTSGGDLFRRGYRKHIGEAPLRENLAASLLWLLLEEPWPERLDLIDPMMGSGTFLSEAYLLFSELERSSAYKNFPLWKKEPDLPEISVRNPFANFYGLELDSNTLSAAQANFKEALIPPERLYLKQADGLSTPAESAEPYFVITNPPYGVRLDLGHQSREHSLSAMLEKLTKIYPAQKIGVLLPELAGLRLPPGRRWRKLVSFRNGGLAVQFLIAS